MKNVMINLEGNRNFFIQEAYKVFRSNLQFCGQDVKVIVLTSCCENEGKSTISLQIGKSFAELGKKVLVIDADMRKSVMAGRDTDVQNPHGLSEVLTGLATFDNSVYNTQYEGFDILFSGKYPPNPVELLESRYFGELIAYVREKYDYVIVDTAPLGLVIDAAIIAPQCDGTVIVMSDKVKYGMARDVVDQLKKSNARILGVVRNKINITKGENAIKRHRGKNEYYMASVPMTDNTPMAGPESAGKEKLSNRARAKARSNAKSAKGQQKRKH